VSEAQELRDAARLMRERAQAATPGPWQHECMGSDFCMVFVPARTIREHQPPVARFSAGEWMRDHRNAEHVASWSPEMALVIADLVDDAAYQLEVFGDRSRCGWPAAIALALTIARTYLRSRS
jgi:hypothetical protein